MLLTLSTWGKNKADYKKCEKISKNFFRSWRFLDFVRVLACFLANYFILFFFLYHSLPPSPLCPNSQGGNTKYLDTILKRHTRVPFYSHSYFFMILASISSAVGYASCSSFGRSSNNLYSLTPIGLVISFKAYSATNRFSFLHKISPTDGLSNSLLTSLSNADK